MRTLGLCARRSLMGFRLNDVLSSERSALVGSRMAVWSLHGSSFSGVTYDLSMCTH